MNKKIIITGSCGFLMGNFLRKAIYEKQPYQFTSIDRVNDNAANSVYWNKSHTFHIADIRDQHIVDTLFQFDPPDVVIHAASESENESNSFITSNVLGTQVIINACLKHKVKKLIYISTDKVYGQLNSETDASWTEDTLLNPRNAYAVTKAAGEQLVKSACELQGLTYNIIRLSNSYGPRQSLNKLVPKTIKSIIKEEKISVYDQGLQIRDWTHVFDACAGIINILNNGKDNEIYNLSSGQEFSNIEVVQKICNAMNKGHNLINFVEVGRPQDFRYAMNTSKIKELGWKPEYKFKDGIVDCINWFIANKWILK